MIKQSNIILRFMCCFILLVSFLILFPASAVSQLQQNGGYAGDLPYDYGNMLVITYDDFETEMLPFVEWKNMKGIPTEMVTISDIPNGTKYEGVKDYISSYYQYYGLTFVLLVGDVQHVPTLMDWFATGFPGQYMYGSSDPSYAYIDGDDIPDIYVGRFPAATTDDVRTMVERSLSYEKDPQGGQSCYSKALCLAGETGWMHDAMDDVDSILTIFGYDVDNMYAPFLNPNTVPSRINTRINDGRGLVFYAGHGLEYRWSLDSTNPYDDYMTNHVYELNNTRFPVVVSAACVNAAFWSLDECFGEAWLRATDHTDKALGAIGFFGASGPVPTPIVKNVPIQFAHAVARLSTPSCPKKTTLGGLCFEASYTAYCYLGSPFFFQVFHVFGDPSLQVYTKTPDYISADYPVSLPPESTEFDVTIRNWSDSTPVPGALCAVSQNSQLLGCAFTDLNGEATVTFEKIPGVPCLDFVVTAYNKSRIRITIGVQQPPPDEKGNMLIITHPDFYDAVLPLVNWKNMKGVHTEIVDVTTIGNDQEDLKAYLQDYYDTYGLAFALLVGDMDRMPCYWIPSYYHSGNIASDPSYTYMDGDGDHYPNFYIGRFSAGSVNEVETMVHRSIIYEKEPEIWGDWYHKGSCFGGDMTPLNLQRIRDMLLSSTYTHVDYLVYPFLMGDIHPVIEYFNDGRSIAFYQGHGLPQLWGFVDEDENNPHNLSISDLNDLENVGRLPLIIHNGCFTGDFTAPECIAEEFLRIYNGTPDQPTGAIGYFGSSDNQLYIPYNPGDDALYEMSKIVAGSSENKKTSIGGICFGGCVLMNDEYAEMKFGYAHTDAWHLFGDPSIQMRTDTPYHTNVQHDQVIFSGTTTFEVEVTNLGYFPIEDALCAISREGNPLRSLLGKAYTNQDGLAVIEFDEPITADGDVDLVVTGFNKVTYLVSIPVVNP